MPPKPKDRKEELIDRVRHALNWDLTYILRREDREITEEQKKEIYNAIMVLLNIINDVEYSVWVITEDLPGWINLPFVWRDAYDIDIDNDSNLFDRLISEAVRRSKHESRSSFISKAHALKDSMQPRLMRFMFVSTEDKGFIGRLLADHPGLYRLMTRDSTPLSFYKSIVLGNNPKAAISVLDKFPHVLSSGQDVILKTLYSFKFKDHITFMNKAIAKEAKFLPKTITDDLTNEYVIGELKKMIAKTKTTLPVTMILIAIINDVEYGLSIIKKHELWFISKEMWRGAYDMDSHVGSHLFDRLVSEALTCADQYNIPNDIASFAAFAHQLKEMVPSYLMPFSAVSLKDKYFIATLLLDHQDLWTLMKSYSTPESIYSSVLNEKNSAATCRMIHHLKSLSCTLNPCGFVKVMKHSLSDGDFALFSELASADSIQKPTYEELDPFMDTDKFYGALKEHLDVAHLVRFIPAAASGLPHLKNVYHRR